MPFSGRSASMAYKEWGDPRNPQVLLCVHGVTRVADDFDQLARALCERLPRGVPGRGRPRPLGPSAQSQRLPACRNMWPTWSLCWRGWRPETRRLVRHLDGRPDRHRPGVAGRQPDPQADPERYRPELESGGAGAHRRLHRPAGCASPPSSRRRADILRRLSLPFGPHSEAEWNKLAADVLCQDKDGQWTRHYDLGLAQPFKAITPELARASRGRCCGPPTMRSVARRCWCAAPNPIC